MNGKKYKVTIKVVDHPPRYCDDWKEEQKMSRVAELCSKTQLHEVPTEKKPVYKNSLTLQVSDTRNKSGETEFAKKATSGENVDQKLRTNWTCRDSNVEDTSGRQTLDSMVHSREVEGRLKCNQIQFESKRCNSLNIYKLRRSNAIADCNEGSDQNGSSLELDDSGEQYLETLTEIPSRFKRSSLLRFDNSVSSAKHDIWTGKNGFHVDQPVVLWNGNIKESERKVFAMNTNGIGEGSIASDCLVADSLRRPRLNREGSACSSDSIITEIEGLSDDDHEGEVLCAKAEGNVTGPDEEVGLQCAVEQRWLFYSCYRLAAGKLCNFQILNICIT